MDLDRTEEAEVAFARAGDAFPSFPPDPHQTRLDDAARGFSRRMMVIENLIQAQNLAEAKRRIAAVLRSSPSAIRSSTPLRASRSARET